MIKTEIFSSEYFDAESSLSCGQTFRFERQEDGYFVCSGNKACLLRTSDGETVLTAEESDLAYFNRYFDTERDYSRIYRTAVQCGGVLSRAAEYGKGIRIFNQQPFETLVCFLLSQNNHIPRIRATVHKLCEALGEKRTFFGREYYSFPTPQAMAMFGEDFYRAVGAGYRARYLRETAKAVASGRALDGTCDLTAFFGVGRKVADCVSLFAFHRTDRFPVDTWLEKVYREDFGGTEKDRNKIASCFEAQFGDFSGYFQQYLFYYKRSLAKGKQEFVTKNPM